MIEEIFGNTLPDIVLFDMDHTLIACDSDLTWKEFLCDEGIIGQSELELAYNYYESYCRNELDVESFIRYQFKEITGKTKEELSPLFSKHFVTKTKPNIYPYWISFLTELKSKSIPTGIVTATNSLVASQLFTHFDMNYLFATELETSDTIFTGTILGEYCYGSGKAERVLPFLEKHSFTLEKTAYFGDSLSDYPLLSQVGYPCMVNPKENLKAQSLSHWKEIELNLE